MVVPTHCVVYCDAKVENVRTLEGLPTPSDR